MRVALHFLLWRVGLASATTQTTARERAALARHAQGRRRAVEIGVWHGLTAREVRMTLAPDATYFAVDPYVPGRLGVSFQRMIARKEAASGRGALQWLRLTGRAAAEWYRRHRPDEPVDFLFIDGLHTYDGLREDWEAWRGLIALDGVVGLHDSRSMPGRDHSQTGSARFTREVILHDAQFECIEEIDTLTVVRRVSPGRSAE